MAHHLTGCVLVPHFPVQIALHQPSTTAAVPLIVATSTSDHGVVVDASIRATHHGVRPGMHVFEARRRAPSLQVFVSNAQITEQAAAQIEAILSCHANTIQRIAPGCWMLPLYALGAGFTRAGEVADWLCQEVRDRTGFACVVGVATQPVIARVAAETGVERRNGAIVVRPGAEQAFLAPLPVRLLPGVGARTEATLQRLGITTVGQLGRVEETVLATLCGSRAQQITRAARGLPTAAVSPAATIRRAWQVSGEPETNVDHLRARLYAVTVEVGRSLRAQDQAAGIVTVHVTWTDGTVGRQSIRWRRRSDLDRELAAGSRSALDVLLHERRLAVRELVVTAGDLGPIQQDLLALDDSRARRLQQALDGIARRYGADAVQPGSLLGRPREMRHAAR